MEASTVFSFSAISTSPDMYLGGDDAFGEHRALLLQARKAGGEIHIHFNATRLGGLFVDRREIAGEDLLAELAGAIRW